MISITEAQRELLLDPIGNNIWSGQSVQTLNSNAITWSLAKQLYGPSGPYFTIPMGIFIGFGATFVHWLICKVSELRHGTQGISLNGLTRFLFLSVGHISVPSRPTISCYLLFTSTLHFWQVVITKPLAISSLTPAQVCWRELSLDLEHSRRSGVTVLVASVPSRMVPGIQLYLGRRARWWCASHDIRAVLRGVRCLGDFTTVSHCK